MKFPYELLMGWRYTRAGRATRRNGFISFISASSMVGMTLGVAVLILVKVRAVGKDRDEMLRLTEIYRGHVVDVTDKSYTIEVTGDASKNDAFLQAIDRSAILETVRTGACGIGRGERILRV